MARIFVKPGSGPYGGGKNPAGTQVKSEGAYKQVSTDTIREMGDANRNARQRAREQRADIAMEAVKKATQKGRR